MKNTKKIIGPEEVMKMKKTMLMKTTTRTMKMTSRVVVSLISRLVQRRTENTVPEVMIDERYERPQSNKYYWHTARKIFSQW